MVCTEEFDVGIDAPSVRSVIVAGGSRSLVDFWQVTGRGGRDGNRCSLDGLHHCQFCEYATAMNDRTGEIVHLHWNFDTRAELQRPTCSRVALEEYLGGASGVPCKYDDSNCMPWDRCEAPAPLDLHQKVRLPSHRGNWVKIYPLGQPVEWEHILRARRNVKRPRKKLDQNFCSLQSVLFYKQRHRSEPLTCLTGKIILWMWKLRNWGISDRVLMISVYHVWWHSGCKAEIWRPPCSDARRITKIACAAAVFDACRLDMTLEYVRMPEPNTKRIASTRCFLYVTGGTTLHASEEFGRYQCPYVYAFSTNLSMLKNFLR